MPPGHAQSEETKKKISEALKKGGSAAPETTQPKRSAEGQALFKQFQDSQKNIDGMKNTISEIQDEMKDDVPPKGASKSLKLKIKEGKKKTQELIKKIKEKIKVEKEKQKAIKQKAMEAKAVEQAKVKIAAQQKRIANANSNLKKSDILETKIGGLMAKAKKPEQVQRLKDSLQRIADARVRQAEVIDQSNKSIVEQQSVVKSKGKITRSVFNFSEKTILLHEKTFSPWRELSLQEKRVDFFALNELFDSTEVEFKISLSNTVKEELDRNLSKMQKLIKAGDINGLADLQLVSAGKLNNPINAAIKDVFEIAKNMAAKEMGMAAKATSVSAKQLMNLDSSMIAESMANEIDLAAKVIARNGLAKGVSPEAIASRAGTAAKDKAGQMITHAVGNVVGENVNKGRRAMFDSISANLQAFQRSEILDGRTCEICLSLDERIVAADDPMSKLDEVHDNCRGIWIPILQSEEIDQSEVGLPASIEDAFDTIGGAPTVNAFTQLKKPMNDENKKVQEEIKRRLNTDGVERDYGH